jgi:2-hydroxychromene-2-carboxylate isomerase
MQIDYYYTLMSPWAYLGAQRFYDLQNKYSFEINHYPLDISKLFSLTGGIPLRKRSEQRKAVRMMELRRWKKKLKLPINFNPKYFPLPDIEKASCMVLSIQDSKIQNLLSLNFFKCVWIEEEDISNVETLLKVCNNLQLDGEKILEDSKDFISFYNSLADKATNHNVFGSPSYVLNNEVFWGQDRLDLLEEKILENF